MSTQTILLAERDSEALAYLDSALRAAGYEVRMARSGADILAEVEERSRELALIMFDLPGPSEDGLQLLQTIRRTDQTLPVIVFSGVVSPGRVVEAMRSGATDFLAKPVTHEQLLRAVKKALGNGAATETPPQAPGGQTPKPLYYGNPAMRAIHTSLRPIAMSDCPVVLRGESGVGKEVIAREIHAHSPRAGKPFLKINCAALPLELLESELFGYEKGAFTGAVKSTPGKFEVADGGMLLLDEIGDMDFKLQAKLLHVLQDSEFQRLGGSETVRVNVRVLAATHCDLEKAMAEKRFREDLFYRLNVISIWVPPLRERKDEILPLAQLFLRKHAAPGMRTPEITPALKEALLEHEWPGNIRELENVMRKLLVFCDPDTAARELYLKRTRRVIPAAGLAEPPAAAEEAPILERVNQARAQAEADAIVAALNHTHWNRKHAARVLNIDYKGLLYKMKKLGIGTGNGEHNGSAPRRSATL